MNCILIFLAGGLGSLLRYAIGLILPSCFFPWTTVAINVAGSFAIGLLGGLGSKMGWSDSLQLALTVGLCGGFTTFQLFRRRRFLSQQLGDGPHSVCMLSVASFLA